MNEEVKINGHKIKVNGYSRGGFGRVRREERQKDAVIRQQAYDKLSLDEKFQLVKNRPGANARELTRLEFQAKENKKSKVSSKTKKGK